jgi:hypothetical protein
MSRWDYDLNVSADEIVVTIPSTIYTVTYYKPHNSPQLNPSKDDSSAPMTQAEFLAQAWRLANKKARKLGWFA